MRKIFLVLIAGLLIWSCTDDDDLLTASIQQAPELSANVEDTISLGLDTEAEEAIDFSWTSANFGVDAAINYMLQWDTSGNNFADPKVLYNGLERGANFTQLQLNSGLTAAGYEPGQPVSLDFRVVAQLGQQNGLQVASNTLTLGTTPYEGNPINFTDVGIIGTGSPLGNWDTDVDMGSADGVVYTLTAELMDGELKFRQDDDWAVNWGAADFPNGVGEQDGPNIPTVAGTYNITFNKESGEYTFEPAGDFPQISIIGSATPGGWDEDTYMFTSDGVNYSLEVDLVEGEAKFRQDSDWAINWGSSDFPTGTAVQDGPNIPVVAGSYMITFNIETGAFNFEAEDPIRNIGLIGSATPGGWDEDTDMMTSDGIVYTLNVNLVPGEAKFRQDDDWADDWGGNSFPMDSLVYKGPNIVIPDSGEYNVTLNFDEMTYNFEKIEIQSVGIIGNATPGGWDEDTDLIDKGDGVYQAVLGLTDGEAKFRANNDWAINWGSGDFPSGVGEQDGPNIPVTAGLYLITFNTNTGEYSFVETSVGIIGSATPGGWDEDTDMMIPDPANPGQLELSVELTDGEAKFRADNDWAINWGSGDFPNGVGEQDGPNIPVAAGTYTVKFNVNTGAYSFE